MRILDLLKKDVFRRDRSLVLDDSAKSQWAQQLVEHKGIDADFKRFIEATTRITSDVTVKLRKITDEDVLAAIPDRARTMNALHGNQYQTLGTALLKTAQFTDLFKFEKEQAAYFEANSTFRDQSSKNASVLNEFLHDEMKDIQTSLQELEDAVIGCTKMLEEKGFPQIRKIRDAQLKLQQGAEREEKYRKLLTSLELDKKRTKEKRLKLEEDIAAQRSLVRNEQALQSLDKIQKVEQELFSLAAQYTSVCQDALAVYKKHPDFTLDKDVKRVLDELPKDPMQFIVENAERIKETFESIIAQFEEERPGNVKSTISRLSRMAERVEQDARTIQTSTPDQRALKREMMKDIAALNIYDKQQFLLRAIIEQETIDHKVAYLHAELDPQNRITIEQEMKDAARKLGALIKNDDAGKEQDKSKENEKNNDAEETSKENNSERESTRVDDAADKQKTISGSADTTDIEQEDKKSNK